MDKLQEIILQMAKTNPKFLEGLENAAAAAITKDKKAIYELFIKLNKEFTYEKLDTLLSRHENQRLDINWNKEDYIYRLVISKRKKAPVKEKKVRLPKELTNPMGGSDNGASGNTSAIAETEGARTKD